MEQPNIEKYIHGQYSLTEEEKKKAKERGDLAEQEKEMKKATGRLRVAQQEEAIRRLNRSAGQNQ